MNQHGAAPIPLRKERTADLSSGSVRQEHMNSDFSRIITLQRKERKISQKQAASDLGISQALLSHYEKGIRECGLGFLVKIADYYNVSCDYLLGFDGY